jgi:hypothetical protein
MSDPFHEIREVFSARFGPSLFLELAPLQDSLWIKVGVTGSDGSFFVTTVSGDSAYRDMIQVERQKEGWGTKLVLAMDFVLKELGVRSSLGHVTNFNVVRILEKAYGREKLTFFRKKFGGLGEQISYEEAQQIPESTGYYVSVTL